MQLAASPIERGSYILSQRILGEGKTAKRSIAAPLTIVNLYKMSSCLGTVTVPPEVVGGVDLPDIEKCRIAQAFQGG